MTLQRHYNTTYVELNEIKLQNKQGCGLGYSFRLGKVLLFMGIIIVVKRGRPIDASTLPLIDDPMTPSWEHATVAGP
jgi:hypothetical protein